MTSKVNDKLWKGVYSHEQLPPTLQPIPTLEDLFPLFHDPDNFLVNHETGKVVVIFKSVVNFKVMESTVPLQLKFLPSEPSLDISSIEMTKELHLLKDTVRLLEEKMVKM